MELEEIKLTPSQKGVLKKKNIMNLEDFVHIVPKDYYDFRNPISDSGEFFDGRVCSMIGKLESVKSNYSKGKSYASAKIRFPKGNVCFVKWFNMPYISKYLEIGATYIFCGKLSVQEGYPPSMVNPLYYSTEIKQYQTIFPIYSSIKGVDIGKKMSEAIKKADVQETVPEGWLEKYKIVSERELIRCMHNPMSTEDIKNAERRNLFNLLYKFALQNSIRQDAFSSTTPFVVKESIITQEFATFGLPYELTPDQRETFINILKKMTTGQRVNAIVQGDVGCGKTISAFLIMMLMAENNFQSVLLAPTSMLASQHYEELAEKMKPLGYNVVYLDGEVKTRQRKEILKQIESGEADMIVGTHAVFSSDVEYNNLGLYITDEEHRFGVEQKEKLVSKAKAGVHSISMSATPIPRTLALSIYGPHTDVYSIKSMPKGRKPVKTIWDKTGALSNSIMLSEIKKGHQCYVVCPLIDENDNVEAESVIETCNKMKKSFDKYGISVDCINGHMKTDEITEIKEKFQEGKLDILVSTTIVEVGINVPNSTVMVIKNAERFGLAQLHQLRGRVGRGKDEGTCIIETSGNVKQDTLERLNGFCSTTNGFEIAELELKTKGSGDFFGIRQSGENKQLMAAIKFSESYQKILNDCNAISTEEKEALLSRFTNTIY